MERFKPQLVAHRSLDMGSFQPAFWPRPGWPVCIGPARTQVPRCQCEAQAELIWEALLSLCKQLPGLIATCFMH